MQFLQKRNPNFWNRANIVLLALLVEHIIIGLKIVVALLIPDVPKSVQQAEMHRVKVIEQVNREMFDLKAKGGHETMEDTMARLQREAAEKTQQEMEE